MGELTLEQIDNKIRDLNEKTKLWKKLRRKRLTEAALLEELELEAR